MTKGGAETNLKEVNDYEKQRLMTIQANKEFMESMGIKQLSTSLTSLVDSTKEKKRKVKQKGKHKDDEYVPNDDQVDEEFEKEPPLTVSTRAKTKKTKEGQKRSKFLPPMSVAKFLMMNKKQQQAAVGDEAMESISKALETVGKAIGSQEHLNEHEGNDENNVHEKVMQDQEFDGKFIEAEIENESEEDSIIGDNVNGEVGGEGAHDYGSEHVELMNIADSFNVGEDLDLTLSGTIRKTRGMVYCRKLTALPPGEKIEVEFDDDGNAIGPHSSLYAFFLGQQVRNRSVCPVQVKEWEDYKPETLDHLWACIKEKCSFDDPEYRKEGVLKHARRLFRDSRHKLKRKYFDNPSLETKEQRIKNKPKDMSKTDWKFLVDHWSDPKFEGKSNKAKKSRSFQKMPHYNGSKSYARLKQEIKKKNGGKCSRVDVMIESRTRKSKKRVNAETLAKNKHTIDEMKKLKEQREQGLNEKTDEQIFQDVLGKDTHGYLRSYGPGKSITKHFQVRPSQLNLAQEVVEVKKTSEQAVQEARKDVESAKKEAEEARKEAEEARKDAESAKKEVEAARNEVDKKISMNNKIWETKLKHILQTIGFDTSEQNDSSSNGSSD